MRRMEALKRDVAGPIAPVPFPLADEGYTLCNVSDHDHGRLKIDGLGAH